MPSAATRRLLDSFAPTVPRVDYAFTRWITEDPLAHHPKLHIMRKAVLAALATAHAVEHVAVHDAWHNHRPGGTIYRSPLVHYRAGMALFVAPHLQLEDRLRELTRVSTLIVGEYTTRGRFHVERHTAPLGVRGGPPARWRVRNFVSPFTPESLPTDPILLRAWVERSIATSAMWLFDAPCTVQLQAFQRVPPTWHRLDRGQPPVAHFDVAFTAAACIPDGFAIGAKTSEGCGVLHRL